MAKSPYSKWVKTAADEYAVERRGCWFDEEHAEGVCRWFENHLVITKGLHAGEPFTLLDWQQSDVIYPIFGWKMPDGARRIRQAYIEIPKKNGKSFLLSGLGLYLTGGDGERGAQVFCCASDRYQAAIVWREAAEMVRMSESMSGFYDPVKSSKTIDFPMTGSFMRALSGDAFSNEGLDIHGLLFDELHAQKTRDLWDALRYGGAARRQPLIASITTAGYDRNSICHEQHEYARKIINGEIKEDISFHGVIYAAGEGDDWTDESTWFKANPSLGKTMNLDSFRSDCLEAQESPVKENSFKRYRLNIWTEQHSRWIQMEKWDACAGKVAPAVNSECFAGLDLASKTDITAFVLYFPKTGEVLPTFWIPEDGMRDRVKRDRVPYDSWVRDGWIQTTEGNITDYDAVRRDINEICAKYDVREIAYDPWNATQFSTQLEDKDGLNMTQHMQGFRSMNEPCKHLEALVLSKTLRHGNNPVLRWMASNVSVKTDPSGNIKIDKQKSTEKVDGMVALAMAVGRAGAAVEKKASVYSGRGMLTL